jgi:hypothetical protein
VPIPESEQQQIEAALPAPAAADLAEKKTPMPAEEALERIRAGKPVENARVERLRLRGSFEQPVVFKDCVLVQPRFDGATFQADVSFLGCTVDRPYFGAACEFHKALLFTGSNLHRVQPTRLTVKGAFGCQNVVTRGQMRFTDCKFEGTVHFWEARFNGWAEFRDCAFAGEADFRSFHAEEGFVLQRCKFQGNVLFRGSTVEKKFEAASTRFEALLDFSKAKLHDYAYLETIELGPDARLAFTNTVGERVRINNEQIENRLASETKGDYEAAMHEYAFLKRNFESLHRYDQEDWAFYRFKVNQRRSRPRSWLKPWTKVFEFFDWLILDQGCGYCAAPFRAVRTAGIIILLFAALYAVGIDWFFLDDAKMPFAGDHLSLANRVTIGLFKSVTVFVSGLGGVGDLAHGWMNLPLITESLLGTMLWGLFIVAFSRKVIR